MEELKDELEALRAILMSDVTIEISSDGVVKADLKLDNCKVTLQFEGKNSRLYL